MSSVYCFKVEKLIRDKLPEIIANEPESTMECHILGDTEFLSSLKTKLIEEANEVASATTHQEIIEELADVIEVFNSLCKALSISSDEINQARIRRKTERGGFDGKVYCKTISVTEKNPERLAYYRARPEHYPELTKNNGEKILSTDS
jgi:predicted house-cleaning noncanonical NTP pyrophosphatase (MazG superfamily)